jgi:hypothetical protein
MLAPGVGKRGTVLLDISMSTASRGQHGIEVAIWSRQGIIAITCQPFGRIARQCYGIKNESFTPESSAEAPDPRRHWRYNPVWQGNGKLDVPAK